MYFDAHCHLNDEKFADNRSTIVADFVVNQWKWLVTVWCDYVSSLSACSITEKIRQEYMWWADDFYAWATLWIHPSEVCFGAITKENIQDRMQQIKWLYEQKKEVCYAIGECGTDLHYDWAIDVIQLQQELLAQQCQFALEVWLPVVIHSRDSFQHTVDILKDFPSLTYYIHCFWYGPTELEYILSHFPNVFIGYDCNISYPKAQQLRDVCLLTPLDKMLLETDSPYLAPQPMRWQVNTPLQVAWLYQSIADLRGVDVKMIQDVIAENYKKLYGIV